MCGEVVRAQQIRRQSSRLCLYAVRLLLASLGRWLVVELGHWRLRWGGIGRRIVLFGAGLTANGRMVFVCVG
jgi:hypothetical protein